MRLSLYSLTLLACFIVFVAAWSKEDQEIFRLRDEVEASEGVGVSFYDFVGVEPSASHDDIIKAFRKKSRALHPDKVKQKFIADRSSKKGNKKGVNVNKAPSQTEIKAATKAASDRYARLGVVKDILRGEGRARYDHFLRNGFPKWKGTGYYYARYRPGLGTVLFGLFLFVGGAGHYLALWMSWKRQQDFILRYIGFAREAAWGSQAFNVPGIDTPAAPSAAAATGADDEAQMPMNRRQRRMQEKDARKDKSKKSLPSSARDSPAATPPAGSTGSKKRVVAENGKILAVDSVGNVYLEQKDEDGQTQEFLLDPDEIPRPTISDTALVRFPKFLVNLALRKVKGSSAESDSEVEEEEQLDIQVEPTQATDNDAEDYELLERVQTTAQNGRDAAVKRKGKRGRRGV